MTLYHGTIMEYAEKIQREGIREMPHQSWQAQRTDLDYSLADLRADGFDTSLPHLTPSLRVAGRYADLRARYETAAVGTVLPAGYVEFRKTAGEVKAVAIPAVIKLEVPSQWKRYLRRDIQDDYGLVALRDVPARYVQEVLNVQAK